MIYIESIKEAPISCMTKDHERLDLFKGLNKVDEKLWAKAKELPLIKAYLEAETLKERKEIRAVSDDEAKAKLKEVSEKGKKDVEPMKTKSEKVVAKVEEKEEVAEEVAAESSEEMSDVVDESEKAE